jgi:hypothetical protein
LPAKLDSSTADSPLWELVLPIMPNLNGFTPSRASSSSPLFNAARAYSPLVGTGAVLSTVGRMQTK